MRFSSLRRLLIWIIVLQAGIFLALILLLTGGLSYFYRPKHSSPATPFTLSAPDTPPSHRSQSQQNLQNLENLFSESSWDFPLEMDRMLHRVARDFDSIESLMDFDVGWNQLPCSPSMDMRDDGDHYLVWFNLPGVKESDIRVSLDDRLLTVEAERSERIPGQRVVQNHFEQKIRLPGPVAKPDRLAVSMTNGVLRVTIPKMQHEAGITATHPLFLSKLAKNTKSLSENLEDPRFQDRLLLRLSIHAA